MKTVLRKSVDAAAPLPADPAIHVLNDHLIFVVRPPDKGILQLPLFHLEKTGEEH